MAFLSLSLPLSATKPPTASFLCPSPPSTSSSQFTTPSFSINNFPLLSSKRGLRRSWIVGMAPDEEKITRRSPLDFPIEWDRPKPGRRPDIFPQFSPMKTPLPPPMPADPPEEDEEEEEEKKEEEDEDQENEDPDNKPQQ
ncbi:hypothetical protein ACJIZ3_025487 [Penstemon smallii]|uniref:Uncharacterized protein n=1 Tax=Penstemon smallii TaxID=265156 RepID=A0ABD3TW36_9LAMI